MFKIVEDPKFYTDSKFIEFCGQYLHDHAGVLEVGPGNGEFSDRLLQSKPGLRYEFLDIHNGLQFQKDRPIQVADVSVARIKQGDETLDAVISAQVIEHVHNMSHFFSEAHRVLKKGGVLLVKIPNFSSIFQRLRFLFKGLPYRLNGTMNNGGHVNFVVHSYLPHFAGDYFTLVSKKGDIFLDPLFTRKIFRLFNKKKYLVYPGVFSVCFSWNVMMCFKKRDN